MRVFHEIEKLPEFTNSVITVGSFDGVHIGHQKILKRVHQLAREIKGESIVITFHPHPRQVIYPKDKSLNLLNTLEEKIELLRKMKVDNVVVIPFSVEFSQQPPREYVEKFLLEKFNPSYIVIGYDHQFGKDRMGNISLLRSYESEHNMKVIEIPKQEIEDIAISSSKVRMAIHSSDFETSFGFLNYHYFLSGKVVQGEKIGASIGYPTANLEIENPFKLIPPDGIYSCYINIDGKRYKGMLYIGKKPSVSNQKNSSIEVNIFDFDGSLYDQFIRVEIVHFLRQDVKYESLELLQEQLHRDKIDALQSIHEVASRSIKSNKIDIIILNYNGQEFLESYLPHLLYSSDRYDFDIIVADNASTDRSIDFLNEYYPEIKCHVFTKNYGFAAGYNKAMENCQSEYAVILNSDVKVSPNWLDPIIKLMESDPSIAACQPKVLSLDQPDHFEYAGAGGGFMDNLGYPFCRGRILEQVELDSGQFNDTREIFWASGAAMVVRSNLFMTFNGFDPDYYAHQEEIDLCWKFRRAGYKIYYCGNSTVYHLGGGTLSYDNPQKVLLNFKNNISTLIKNESGLRLAWIFPLRLILDGAAGLFFLGKGKIKNALAIIKAHSMVYGQIGNLIKKRKHLKELIKENKIGPSRNTAKTKKSIVWGYYIMGRKLFKYFE